MDFTTSELLMLSSVGWCTVIIIIIIIII